MDDDARTLAATPAAIDSKSETLADVTGPTGTSLPGRPSVAPSSGPLPTMGPSMAASIVMASEEAARARAFFRLTAGMVLAAAAFMPFVPGPPALRGFAMGLCVLAAAVGAVMLRALRNENRYTPRLVTAVGVLFGVAGELALFYFGLFTAASMILPLGVYFFGLSESPMAARTTYVVGAVVYGALSVGVVMGLLPDLGPMPIGGLPVTWRWFFVVMTQVVFATTFFLARSSRRATQIAILRVERATRQIQQRDALLAEARGELDRAQRPGEGRFTGQVIAGYTLGDVVGRGGMGEVYAATNAAGERAAVKLLHPTILSDPEQVRRFVREAEMATKVSSPHVARVVGSGLGPTGLPYVAMELLTGKDLAWHLRKSGRLPLSGVVEMVEHASKALVAIREAGIVHRDLKPHNLVLDETQARIWKVLDFGVSRYEAAGNTITKGSALVGTPSYMSPEQIKLEPVDHRSDVYALANVAYRALTGKPAFAGDDLAGVLYHVVHTPPPQPSALVRMPIEVELVLAIGMAKAREDRFQRAEDLAAAFRQAAKGALDTKTRDRGLKMVAKHPWSTPEIRAAG